MQVAGIDNAQVHFLFLPTIWRAEIFASARTIPELVKMASGQRFSAAFRNRAKSSSFIFTFTCVVRFMIQVSAIQAYQATILRIPLVRHFSCALQN